MCMSLTIDYVFCQYSGVWEGKSRSCRYCLCHVAVFVSVDCMFIGILSRFQTVCDIILYFCAVFCFAGFIIFSCHSQTKISHLFFLFFHFCIDV